MVLFKTIFLLAGALLGAWIAALIEDVLFRREMRKAHERAAKRSP